MPEPPRLILLVEDEPDLRELFAKVLEGAGYRLVMAKNYAEGLALLNASSPALLIANSLLPDGDGHELACVGRQLGVPALLVSGDPDTLVEAKALGFPFLAKPFRLTELQQTISTLIGEAPRLQ